MQWGSRRIRIIVLSQVPKVERNAIWHLFSGIAEQVQFGAEHYNWRRDDHSGIMNDLYQYYKIEGIFMPYTWDDYYRERRQEILEQLTPEERLKGLSTKELLKRVPVEERLKGLPTEMLLKRLPAKEIEAYLKKLRAKKRKRK